MSADLNTGRVAVITGASSGIGEATARALHADGHQVALLARRGDRIHALTNEFGPDAIAVEADITDRDSITAAALRVTRNSALPTSWSTTPASCSSHPSAPNGAKNTGAWSRPT